MIDPRRDDMDYGKMLEAPLGYELEFAVGTTYSLDLEALVGAYVALGLSVGCDSSLKDDPAHLFAAMTQVQGKVLVFCEKGRIVCSKEYRQLFSQVEDGIVQVDLEGERYPSFHPKVWILKYKKPHQRKRLYRICVLTRNLTFDGSWDIAACFEGEYSGSRKRHADGGNDLERSLRGLRDLAEGQRIPQGLSDGLNRMLDEIGYVYFGSGSGVFAPQHPYFVVSGFPGGDPSHGENAIARHFEWHLSCARRVLIMSPFLSDDFTHGNPIKSIRDRVQARGMDESDVTLVVRRDALTGHEGDSQMLSGFNIFAVRDELLDVVPDDSGVEEAYAEIKPRDIHAKLFAFECVEDGKIKSYLYIGSANATYRALNTNHELACCLSSENPSAFDVLLSDIGLDEKSLEEGSIFISLQPAEIGMLAKLPADETPQKTRDFDHLLRRVRTKMDIAEAEEEGHFDVSVSVGLDKEGKKVARFCNVQLLSGGPILPVEGKLVFKGVALLNLTEFLRVTCTIEGVGSRLIKCETTANASKILNMRRAAIFKEVVAASDSTLLDYLTFRLSDNPEQFGGGGPSKMTSGWHQSSLSVFSNGLYESLLKAYSTKPERAKAIVDDCIRLMENEEFSQDSAALEAYSLLRAFQGGDKDARI